MKKMLLSIAIVALLAGCASTPKEEPKAAVEDRTPSAVVTPPVRPPVTTAPVAPKVDQKVNPLKEPNNILSKRSIFYELDKYDVRDEYKPLLQAHARYLAENPGARMLIQGNCDERGSREYNIALGQKRSDGIRKTLSLMGAKESQLESVSLGEEKPRCTEQAEECYAQNRRGDMLYGGEY